VIETTYLAETSAAAFTAPQAVVLGLNVPVYDPPMSGRPVAGLDWRQTGGVCPQTAVRGLVPTSIPTTKAVMAGVGAIAAFDNKHSVRGLSAWSPPI
jgi:hypothetical protein